jgi:Xaa-Pro aminopeptidase
MLTMQPTLLIGPSDWQGDVIPRSEFVERIEALWQSHPQAEHAIVYGNSAHHAELAYFTNFVPKLDAAVALLSRAHERRLLVGGGANMLGAARPLTWIENVSPLKEIGDANRGDPAVGPTLLVGADYMPMGFRHVLVEAIGPGKAQDATALVWAQMARKSPREIEAIRRARAAKGAATAAMMEASAAGANASSVLAAGEEAAYAEGAQDARTLFSLDGGRTFRPFLVPVDTVVDPLNVYVAVRRFNYWADGFALLTRASDDDPVLEIAIGARDTAMRLIKAGAPTAEVAARVEALIRPYRIHPITARTLAQRMGLALDERPYTDVGATFEDGEVYSLRVGATDGVARHQFADTMIRVRGGGHDVL